MHVMSYEEEDTHTHTRVFTGINLRTGTQAMQHQLGMTGLVEAAVTLINQSPHSPWASTQHVTGMPRVIVGLFCSIVGLF
jgi:hypothetical protein